MAVALNLLKEVNLNEDFRKVLVTTDKQQVIAMNIFSTEETGFESHDTDQFIFVIGGKCQVNVIDEQGIHKMWILDAGFSISIQAGTNHNLLAILDSKIITVYSSPVH